MMPPEVLLHFRSTSDIVRYQPDPYHLKQLVTDFKNFQERASCDGVPDGFIRLVVQAIVIRPFRDLDPASNPSIGIGNHGGYPNTPHNFPFNGLIDELSDNRALTAGEVLGLYKAGSDGKVFSPIAVDSPSVVEGTTGSTAPVTFTITRTGSLSGFLTVNWTTADDTATVADDYVAASGQVIFADGEATKTVQVMVNGDSAIEPNETLKLIATPAGGTAVMGVATIIADDVSISIGNASATEGDGSIGQWIGAFVSRTANGGMERSSGMAWGPDGNLYVGSFNTGEVLRFDRTTGAFLGAFINADAGLDTPAQQGLSFRPDGKLYVLSRDSAQVRRFDATTGVFLDVFIPPNSGGLTGAKGMTIGSDGNWYISSGDTNQVAFLGVFVSAGSGGLSTPRALAFGPDGNLYVSSSNSNAILRYNGQTGAFIDAFIPAGSGGLVSPAEMLFSGTSLYVSSQSTNEVLRYASQTGAFLDKAVTAGLGGLDRPLGLLLDSNNNLLVGSNNEILSYGPRSLATFSVSLNFPSAAPVTVSYSTADGTARVADGDYTAGSGTFTFAPGETAKIIIISTVDNTTIELAETFTVSLSNPTGGIIGAGQGTGTILDNDTKFYVINDSTTDRSYEYASNGAAGESYNLGSGNTAPRGAAHRPRLRRRAAVPYPGLGRGGEEMAAAVRATSPSP
jgi:WD40 repeat protein